jgi:hypothetical protein
LKGNISPISFFHLSGETEWKRVFFHVVSFSPKDMIRVRMGKVKKKLSVFSSFLKKRKYLKKANVLRWLYD